MANASRGSARGAAFASLVAALGRLSGLSACAQEAPRTPEMQAAADQAARVGALILAEESAHTRASEALAASPPNPPVRGSVTRLAPDGTATTSFLVPASEPPQVAYEVVAPPGSKPRVARIDPPRPLDPEGAAILRAEATAMREVRVQCGDRYEPVALPGELLGKDGWLVVLLATFDKPNVRVLAGHQLVRVSADGSRAVEQASFADKCVVADASLQPGDAVMLSRSAGDVPTPADYYAAGAHQVRLDLVFPDGRVWRVNAP